MELVGPREQLVESARRKGEARMAAYRARKNAASIDGATHPRTAEVGRARSKRGLDVTGGG
jgi:hypothetical protein